MGLLLEKRGKLAEAEPYVREALEARRRILGDEHPDTLSLISGMGLLLRAQGKLSEAEPYSREAFQSACRALGEEHADTLMYLKNLALLLEAQDKPAEAIALVVPAESAVRRVFGAGDAGDAATVSDFLTFLGRCRSTTGAFDTAETNLTEAYAILSETKYAMTERRKDVLSGLVELYESWHAAEPGQGHDTKAAEWRARLAEWQASTQPAAPAPSAPVDAPASQTSEEPRP